MKRDMGLVREVLLRVEALDILPGERAVISSVDEAFQIEGFSNDHVDGHLRLLVDGGFISGKTANDGVLTDGLTWEGCEFLDTVRSPEVWRRTKEAALKVGGVSIAIVAEIAKAIGKSYAKELLGLELG